MSKHNELDRTGSQATGGNAWPDSLIYRTWKMRFARGFLLFAALCVAWLLGRWWAPAEGGAQEQAESAGMQAEQQVLYWTCSMHPQIKLPKSGACPICFMDLVPVQTGDTTDADAPVLGLSPRARELARVQTSPVELRELTHEIGMVGKVVADETRITQISSYIPGRLDRLFVNYTGILVRKGDHLAEIYSPELLVAQREFVLALESAGQAGEAEINNALLASAKRKLELWGVPRDELESLAEHRRPTDHMRIDAPLEGWVLERQGFEGMYVETGTRLFTLVDLRSVWVLLDAYEMDLDFVHVGQDVEFQTEASPGESFSGRVSYLDPMLSSGTRTVKVRVNVPNPDLKLRPGMFVRARLRVRLGAGGVVLDDRLTGKWMCYMHPEVIKDAAGDCDVCGMKLVTAESLGYAGAPTTDARVLAVPQTAVLLTGRRAVVYVEKQDGEGIRYEGREIEVGSRAGDYFIVRDGLTAGERVVTRGAIMIDSALQIQAKPSMMQSASGSEPGMVERPPPEAQVVSRYVAGGAYHRSAAPMISACLELTSALARDDVAAARSAVDRLKEAAQQSDVQDLPASEAESYRAAVTRLKTSLPDPVGQSIEDIRNRLPAVTTAMLAYLRTYGHDRPAQLVRAFCPMAMKDRGAEWLQEGDQIANPYFGASMLRCGEVRGRINPDGSEVK